MAVLFDTVFRFALLWSEAVGLDWILLFLHRNTHTETVTHALRILIQLLSIEKLQQKFHEGEIFGSWVKGFENLPPELSTLLETTITQFNPLKPHSQFPLPGVAILSHVLPHHLHSPQVFLLMIAFLLGKTGLDIPFSATFDMETLDNAFQVGSSVAITSVRLCPDAAFVLLAMARVMLHQVHTCTLCIYHVLVYTVYTCTCTFDHRNMHVYVYVYCIYMMFTYCLYVLLYILIYIHMACTCTSMILYACAFMKMTLYIDIYYLTYIVHITFMLVYTFHVCCIYTVIIRRYLWG